MASGRSEYAPVLAGGLRVPSPRDYIVITMKARLIRIGNSRGVRIPKAVIDQVGLGDDIELQVEDGRVVITAASPPRTGWAAAAKELATESRGRRFPGRTFWLYMLLYAISRYIIEFFRGDLGRGTVLTIFSTSQFISVILAPLAIIMLVYLSRRDQPEPKQARRRAA